ELQREWFPHSSSANKQTNTKEQHRSHISSNNIHMCTWLKVYGRICASHISCSCSLLDKLCISYLILHIVVSMAYCLSLPLSLSLSLFFSDVCFPHEKR